MEGAESDLVMDTEEEGNGDLTHIPLPVRHVKKEILGDEEDPILIKREFKCDKCPKAFNTKGKLRQHLQGDNYIGKN